MTDIEILSDLKDKSFYKIIANIKKLTGIEQFTLNGRWTDYLQERVVFGNKYLLKDFLHRLIMEDV
jgi:hypothetical protein